VFICTVLCKQFHFLVVGTFACLRRSVQVATNKQGGTREIPCCRQAGLWPNQREKRGRTRRNYGNSFVPYPWALYNLDLVFTLILGLRFIWSHAQIPVFLPLLLDACFRLISHILNYCCSSVQIPSIRSGTSSCWLLTVRLSLKQQSHLLRKLPRWRNIWKWWMRE
jgi:hypothetical protein